MEIHKFRDTYQVRAYEIDAAKKCSPPALIQIMHEASLLHAVQLGVSVWDLEAMKISWVLRSVDLKIMRLPMLNEELTVETYPSGRNRMFSYRDFFVYDQENNLIATNSSKWVLMNTDDRNMATIPKEMDRIVMPDEADCLPRPNERIPKMDRVDFENKFLVNWYDLDFNEHLNNVKYITWALQSLDISVLKRDLTGLKLIYKREAKYGENIVSQTQKIDNDRFIHRLIRTEDNQELVCAESTWK